MDKNKHLILKWKPSVILIVLFSLTTIGYSNGLHIDPSESDQDSLEIFRDIEYVRYGDRKLLLDVYRPFGLKNQKLPVIVAIRGGGWRAGNKEGYANISAHLAREGFAIVCIEYRTSKEVLYPAAVLDVKSAINWVIDNSDTYDLDTERIGALGGSAGAHLAMLAAFSNKNPSLNPSGKVEKRKVKAVVGMATPADFTQIPDNEAVTEWLGKTYKEDTALWYAASPYTYIDEESPPMLFMHSTVDGTVPFDQSISSVKKMATMNIYSELVMIPDARHAFWTRKIWFSDTMNKVANFFKEQLK